MNFDQLQEQSKMDSNKPSNVLDLAAEIVSAYVRNNPVPAGELPGLLQSVHDTLARIATGAQPEAPAVALVPKVPVKKSVTDDFLICLEDGKRFRSMKRHLQSAYGMSPQDYRDKWGLPKNYPMVAPAYAKARSDLAKSLGLGHKTPAPIDAAPVPTAKAATQKTRKGGIANGAAGHA